MTTTKTKNYHGSKINQYTLVENLGEGSHGVVYKAFDKTRPDEPLAVKIIEDKGNLDTLLIEPELLSRLHHPHIIDLKDYFLYSGNLVLVTEYINGVNLDAYLKQRGKLTEQEVIIFLTQMADALVQAHGKNIIHRDIKLSNILVTGSGENIKFVLVDFGVSRMAEGIQTVKRVAGTYYYMAPEQLRGRPCEQSDLWALGVCAYALLTGSMPFTGRDDELLQKILFDFPKAPTNIVPGIDLQLESIIFGLLEKELNNRTHSASVLLEGLKKLPKASFTQAVSKPLPSKKPVLTWEQQDRSEIKKSWILFWIFVMLANIPEGLIVPALSLGGSILFYIAQEKRNFWGTLGGIFLVIIGFLAPSQIYVMIARFGAGWLISLGLFFFQIVAVHYLIKIRRLQEKFIGHKILRKASPDRNSLIKILHIFVGRNDQNMNLRLKYINLLLSNNQLEEAIVEAKLAVDVDPYSVGATLLLASGYFQIGLYDECIQVCNGYLTISPYIFELQELKSKCLNKLMEV